MESIEVFALVLILAMVGVLAFFIINIAKHIDSENKKKAMTKNIFMEEKKEADKKEELKLNPKSIWSFGLGIFGILGFYLLSYIAIVISIFTIQEINKNKEKYKGLGFAIAGLVIGLLGALANIGQYFIN